MDAAKVIHQHVSMEGDPSDLGAQVCIRVITPMGQTIQRLAGVSAWLEFETALITALLTEVTLAIGPELTEKMVAAATQAVRESTAFMVDAAPPARGH